MDYRLFLFSQDLKESFSLNELNKVFNDLKKGISDSFKPTLSQNGDEDEDQINETVIQVLEFQDALDNIFQEFIDGRTINTPEEINFHISKTTNAIWNSKFHKQGISEIYIEENPKSINGPKFNVR